MTLKFESVDSTAIGTNESSSITEIETNVKYVNGLPKLTSNNQENVISVLKVGMGSQVDVFNTAVL